MKINQENPELIKRKRILRNPWQDVTLLSVLIMQLCWLVPWYRVITMSPENINPGALDDYFLFAGLILIPYGAAWLMDWMKINRKSQKTGLFILLLVLLAVSLFSPIFLRERVNYMEVYSQSPGDISSYQYYVPNEIIVVLVVYYLWRMGSSIAQHGLGTKGVIGHFVAGLVLFFFYILLNMATGTGLIPGLEIFIFLFFGLLGLSTTRIAMLRRLIGGSTSPFSLKWLGSIAGATFVIFSLTYLLAWLVGGDVSRWIVSTIVGGTMGLIAFLVSFLVTPLFNGVQWMIDWLNLEFVDPAEVVQGELPGISGGPITTEMAPPGPLQIFSFVYLGLFLIVIVVSLIIMFRVYRDRKRKPDGKWESDVLYRQRGNLFDALRSLFDGGLNLNERWQEFKVRLADKIHARERIRYIFACLLDMADDMNISRPNSDTPLEFTGDLIRLFPDDQAQLHIITQAYNRVRYGQIPETELEVKTVEEAWLVVKESGMQYLEAMQVKG